MVLNEVCSLAGVEGHTPHNARHAMGRHLIDKTGNISAVQRLLGYTNAAYFIQYGRLPTRNWLRRWTIGDLAKKIFFLASRLRAQGVKSAELFRG